MAPETVAAMQRESLMRSGHYDRLVKLGEVPHRLPHAKRQELFRTFADATDDKGKWSLTHPFDDLNAEDMQAVANAVFNATGLRVRDFPIRLDKVLPGLSLNQA